MNLTYKDELQLAPLSDSNRNLNTELPLCYSFRNYWIEITNEGNKKGVWSVFIHFGNERQTVIAMGSYSSRAEASIKAEQVITRWHS